MLHKNKQALMIEESPHSPSFFASLIHPFIQCGVDGICLLIVFLIRPTGEQTACIAVELEDTEDHIYFILDLTKPLIKNKQA